MYAAKLEVLEQCYFLRHPKHDRGKTLSYGRRLKEIPFNLKYNGIYTLD